ncbi:MAG: hypothetical protein OXF45_04165 [Candidatus Dadabacteria bacterium]|nr:hypothetical protein [Candidatus Dadabacteria bacterium]
MAVGSNAEVIGRNAVGVGRYAVTYADDSVAIGRGATISSRSHNSIAIGKDATITDGAGPGLPNTILIGHGLQATAANQIRIGGAVHEDVRIGAYDIGALNAAISAAAIGTMGDTPNATGSVHARINYAQAQVGNHTDTASHSETASAHARINHNRNEISKSREESRKGTVMAMAMEAPYVAPDKRATFGMSHAGYRGEHGLAASFGVRVNEQIQVHFSGATDTGFDEKAIKSGFQFSW